MEHGLLCSLMSGAGVCPVPASFGNLMVASMYSSIWTRHSGTSDVTLYVDGIRIGLKIYMRSTVRPAYSHSHSYAAVAVS